VVFCSLIYEHKKSNLFSQLEGQEGSDPVLLLHGLGGCHRSWQPLDQDLASTHRVMSLDLRGCGRSEAGRLPLSLDLLADDCVALLDHLNIEAAHVVGHSLGGVVAQNLLVRHNQRLLSTVLVSTSSRLNPEATRMWRRLADMVEQRGLPDSADSQARAFSPQFAAEYPQEVARQAGIAASCDPLVYAAQARAASSYDYTEDLKAVTQPVLVIQGLADHLTPVGGSVILSRALPNSTLELEEGIGHSLPTEMGGRFVARLRRFFGATP
jgi:3-oxoadipate enol-lactonase